MKKKKVSILVLLFAILLVLYFTLKNDYKNIIMSIVSVNKLYFTFGITLFLFALFLKSISLKIFLSEYKKDYKLSNSFKLTLIGQLLNGITPFSSGGQPFQIYMLKKENIRISDSTNAMLKDFFAYQVALILIGLVAFVLNWCFNIVSQNGTITFLIYLGFIINVIVLLVLILVMSAKEPIKKVATKFINFLFKHKFMNRFKTSKDKMLESLDHFYETGKEIKKNRLNLLKGILCNIIAFILMYSIPCIVFISLGNRSVSVQNSIILTAFVMLIGNFIPIPGATGGLEYSFMQFFGVYVKNPVLSSAMLLWRFITYIFGMLIGFVFLITKQYSKFKKD